MELSERYIQTLEKEGFDTVYEWQDEACHSGDKQISDVKTAIMVTDGFLIVDLEGVKLEVTAGKRIDIPANQLYSLSAGVSGAIYIVGEMDK